VNGGRAVRIFPGTSHRNRTLHAARENLGSVPKIAKTPQSDARPVQKNLGDFHTPYSPRWKFRGILKRSQYTKDKINDYCILAHSQSHPLELSCTDRFAIRTGNSEIAAPRDRSISLESDAKTDEPYLR
jgi:hypothetical protein